MKKRIYQYIPPAIPLRELDYQLAHDALCGDTDAWDALSSEAFSFVRCDTKNFDSHKFFSDCDHDDIVAEAFTRCYEQLDRYQGLSRFGRWVSGYAKNIMRNRRRAQFTVWRNQWLLEDIARSQFRNMDSLSILIRLERNQFLWNAFYQLALPEQTVLYLRVFFCTPFRELAKRLKLTHKQVRQVYQDAIFKTRWNYLRQYR